MPQRSEQTNELLAAALLDSVPKMLRHLLADVPVDGKTTEKHAEWRDVSELRATPGQLTLLRVLVEHERCMMQELAEHLAVTPPTVTAMVKRLFAQGYVERCRDEGDWRTVWVKPTERGRQVVEIFDRARLASLQRRLARLSAEERSNLMSALPALRHLAEG